MALQLDALPGDALDDIIAHLATHTIPLNHYRLKVGDGRSQTWGIVRKRSLPPDLSRNSWNDAKLHHLLMEFANTYIRIPFTSIQVNDSFICMPHKDVSNIGQSYIVGFGDYTGGLLKLHTEPSVEVDIRVPHLFNGSEVVHSTTPFTGRRFSLVFHTICAPMAFPGVRQLSDYTARQKNIRLRIDVQRNRNQRDEWEIRF